MSDHHTNALSTQDSSLAKNSMVQTRGSELPGYGYRESGGSFAETAGALAGMDLRAIWRILNKRKWLIGGCIAACLLSGLLWTLLKKPLYTASLRLEIARSAPKMFKGDDIGLHESDAADIATEIELLKSHNLAERVASLTHFSRDLSEQPTSASSAEGSGDNGQVGSRTRIADGVRQAARVILDGLLIKLVPGTRLVDIRYTDPQPVRAQRIANAYGEAFVATNLDKRFQANAHAKSFLEDQLAQIKHRLEDSQKAMIAFAEKEQIIATSDKASITENELSAANAALGAVIAERIKNEQLWRQTQSASAFDLPQILTNKAIGDLRSQRGQLVAQYQEKSDTFRADYPAMVQLNNKIKEIDRQLGIETKMIKSSLKGAYDASLGQETDMKQRIEKLRTEALDLQKRSIRYNILKHEVETTRSLYENLLQRYKEVDVASGVGTNNVFVVDKAQLPVSPSSPNIPKAFLISLALGLVLGIGGAFALEQFDDIIYSPVEAELASGLTLLGVIPKTKPPQTFQAACEDLRSPISESFRSLCTSLHYSTENGVPKTLLITSSRPGEGKSSVALGVAHHFAATGLKVLLLDSDLRNPSLHKKTGLDNSIGLSSYLTHNCEVRDAIRRIEETNLYAMTSGPLPPNPVELLHGPRFASLLSVGGEIFDLIIIDGPPVMGMADSLILANMTSTTLLVIAAGEGRTHQVRGTLKRLGLARARPLGMILNKFAATSAYGYGYGYGYEYGYGYGAEMAADSEKLEKQPEHPRKLNSDAAAAS